MKLLTIIIPCYNAEKYINRCFSSLNKIKGEINAIFVNDGSTDSTKEIIERYIACNDDWAILINKSNGGYSTAINAGLDNCNSEYVMFMGVDDEIIADGIRNVLLHLELNKPDILAFSTSKIDDEKANPPFFDIDSLATYDKPGFYETGICNLYNEIGNDSLILFSRDTSRCYKKSLINNLRYFGARGVSADGCFSALLSYRATSFEFLNENCYLWHLHGDSVSKTKQSIVALKDEANVWHDFFDSFFKASLNCQVIDPIVSYILRYEQVLFHLKKKKEKDFVKPHVVFLRTVVKLARKNKCISFKYSLFLCFHKFIAYRSYIKSIQ